MNAPTIILLNGSSSSGKSTIARSLQRRIEPQPVLIGLDSFVFGHLPPAWLDSPYGCSFTEAADGSVHLSLGEGGLALAKAFHRAVIALADCGLSVIVDDVLFEDWLLQDWLEATRMHEVYFVGVRCDLAEAERREVERGDRRPGQARSHFEKVHAHGIYDAIVDTTSTSPRVCAQDLVSRLAAPRSSPSAFERLRAISQV
jgi:chloramphenicol 3-O phosphotransferase